MVRDPKEREVSRMIKIVSEKYLNISASEVGCINYDTRIDKSINMMIYSSSPELYNNSEISQGSYEIVMRLIKK